MNDAQHLKEHLVTHVISFRPFRRKLLPIYRISIFRLFRRALCLHLVKFPTKKDIQLLVGRNGSARIVFVQIVRNDAGEDSKEWIQTSVDGVE